MRGLDAGPLQNPGVAVGRRRRHRHIQVLPKGHQVTEARRGRNAGGGVGRPGQHETAGLQHVAGVDGPHARPLTRVLRMLQIAESQGTAGGQDHLDYRRLDQHLRQHHVQLRHDLLDDLHVLLGRKHQQRVRPLVRNDLRLPQHLNLPARRRPIDDALQPLRKRTPPAPPVLPVIPGAPALPGGVTIPASSSRETRQWCRCRPVHPAHPRSRRTPARRPSAHARPAAPAAQTVHRPGDVRRLPILDRNHLLHILRGNRHIDLAHQLQHPLHVLRVVPQHQDLAPLDRQDRVRDLHKPLQHRHQLARLRILQLQYVRHILPHLRQARRAVRVERRPGRVPLRLRHRLHKLLPHVHHRHPVERQHRVQRLDPLPLRQLPLRLEHDRSPPAASPAATPSGSPACCISPAPGSGPPLEN